MHFCEEPPFLGPQKLLMSKELVSTCFYFQEHINVTMEETEIDIKVVQQWEDN